MDKLQSIVSTCKNYRIKYDPDWSPSLPYQTFRKGTAGRSFNSLKQAVNWLKPAKFEVK